MYICICKAVTDSQLESAINQGKCTRRQLFDCFGVGGDCGKCNKDIRELVKQQARNQQIVCENELVVC